MGWHKHSLRLAGAAFLAFLALSCGGGGAVMRPVLSVHGLEVTQGTQFFHSGEHLTGAYGEDNSVRLVAGKAAWVRVYVRCRGLDVIHNVSGTLTVERREAGVFWQHVTDLTPRPPGAVHALADPPYEQERGALAHTINFVLPADLACGTLRLTAQVASLEGHTASRTQVVDMTFYQRLRMRAVMVGYDDHATPTPLVLPPPTLAEMEQIAAWTVAVYPVGADADFGLAGTFTHDATVYGNPDPAAGCGDLANWGALEARYHQIRTADGDLPGFVYYGLLAVGHPGANSAGCGGPEGVFSGAGEEVPAHLDGSRNFTAEAAMAHELGHHLGRQHAPGETPDPDPAYPAYQAAIPGQVYEEGSIGEYGLNVLTGTIYPPDQFADFMSYRDWHWISPFSWQSYLGLPRLNPSSVCRDTPPFPDPPVEIPEFDLDDQPDPWGDAWEFTPVIDVVAVLEPGEPPAILSVTRARVASALEGTPTAFRAELLDAGGTPLASGDFVVAGSRPSCRNGCPVGDARLLKARLPDVAPGAALRVLENGAETWRRTAPVRPPAILSFTAAATPARRLAAAWTLDAPEPDRVDCWLRWAVPGGEDWRGLAVGLQGGAADVDLVGVPGGDILVQLVAHDGFSSVSSSPVPIALPPRPLSVAIVSPFPQQDVRAGGTLLLTAVAAGDVPGPVGREAFTWEIDGIPVGEGREVIGVAPPAGGHRCAVRLAHGGQEATAQVSFTTTEGDALR